MRITPYPCYLHGQLDAQAETILNQIAEMNAPPIATLTPLQAREYPFNASWIGNPNTGVRIDNLTIPGSAGQIPLRIYTPEGNPPYPILMFFHGGGFVVGTLDEFDPVCTFLAAGASCLVTSVDYRLAPEHPHPAAVEDAVTAVNWVAAHAHELRSDPTRIAVAGDSAGANLATVVARIVRDQGGPNVISQILICPWVDASSLDSPSFHYFGDGVWLSKAAMCWYRSYYLSTPEQALSPIVSPLLADDLSGLPPAFVLTAEFDVLRDQGEAYVHRLEAAGVSVQWTRYPGMLHDFAVFPGLFDRAKEAIDTICLVLQKAYTLEPLKGGDVARERQHNSDRKA